MYLLLNLISSITVFILVTIYSKDREVKIPLLVLLEVSWVYWIFSLILFFGLTLQDGMLFIILLGLGGCLALPLEMRNRKLARARSMAIEYIQTIEYLFNNGPEKQLFDALNGLQEEAIDDADARIALEQLSERDDPLGTLIRRHIT